MSKYKDTDKVYVGPSAKSANRRDNIEQASRGNSAEDMILIEQFYQWVSDFNKLNKFEGTDKLEVDHICPLIHEDLSGLHNIYNLQAISKKENTTKGNRVQYDKNTKLPIPQRGAILLVQESISGNLLLSEILKESPLS